MTQTKIFIDILQLRYIYLIDVANWSILMNVKGLDSSALSVLSSFYFYCHNILPIFGKYLLLYYYIFTTYQYFLLHHFWKWYDDVLLLKYTFIDASKIIQMPFLCEVIRQIRFDYQRLRLIRLFLEKAYLGFPTL